MANNPYVNKVIYGDQTVIDLTMDTLTASNLTAGVTGHDRSGAPIVGTANYYSPSDTEDNLLAEAYYIPWSNDYGTQKKKIKWGDLKGLIRNMTNTLYFKITAGSRTTIDDSDEIPVRYSNASSYSDSARKITWSNFKATLKTYFDTLYAAISHTHTASDITSGLATVATTGSYDDLVDEPTVETAASGGTTRSLVTTGEKYIWNNKQDELLFDTWPTSGSNNPVRSNGIASALATKTDRTETDILGAKNLLPMGVTQTISGVTFTVDEDGEVTFRGTNSSADKIYYPIYPADGSYVTNSYRGNILSGCMYGSESTYYLCMLVSTDETTISSEYPVYGGDQLTIPLLFGKVRFAICVCGSQTVSNTITPMLRLGTDPYNNYVPYAMTNRELTTDAFVTGDKAETALADSDTIPFYDASATAKRKSTWSNIKSVLKTYFDTLYSTVKTRGTPVSGGTTLSLVNTGDMYTWNNKSSVTTRQTPASGGTTLSLVNTGDMYNWNNKQNATETVMYTITKSVTGAATQVDFSQTKSGYTPIAFTIIWTYRTDVFGGPENIAVANGSLSGYGYFRTLDNSTKSVTFREFITWKKN